MPNRQHCTCCTQAQAYSQCQPIRARPGRGRACGGCRPSSRWGPAPIPLQSFNVKKCLGSADVQLGGHMVRPCGQLHAIRPAGGAQPPLPCNTLGQDAHAPSESKHSAMLDTWECHTSHCKAICNSAWPAFDMQRTACCRTPCHQQTDEVSTKKASPSQRTVAGGLEDAVQLLGLEVVQEERHAAGYHGAEGQMWLRLGQLEQAAWTGSSAAGQASVGQAVGWETGWPKCSGLPGAVTRHSDASKPRGDPTATQDTPPSPAPATAASKPLAF